MAESSRVTDRGVSPPDRMATVAFVIEMVVAILFVVLVGFLFVVASSFSGWMGLGPGDWVGFAYFAYPVTALLLAIVAVRLWIRGSQWAYAVPVAMVLVPITIAWLALNLP
jgi:hypothetical protein